MDICQVIGEQSNHSCPTCICNRTLIIAKRLMQRPIICRRAESNGTSSEGIPASFTTSSLDIDRLGFSLAYWPPTALLAGETSAIAMSVRLEGTDVNCTHLCDNQDFGLKRYMPRCTYASHLGFFCSATAAAAARHQTSCPLWLAMVAIVPRCA